jgi:stage III sporulation protein SpoIIIAA
VLEVGVRLVRLGESKRPGSETFRDNDQRSQTSTTREVVSHIQEVGRAHNAIYNMQTVVKYSKMQTIIGNPQCASTTPCRQLSAFIHSSPFSSDYDRG